MKTVRIPATTVDDPSDFQLNCHHYKSTLRREQTVTSNNNSYSSVTDIRTLPLRNKQYQRIGKMVVFFGSLVWEGLGKKG